MWILVLIFFVILNIIGFIIPKRLSKIEIYACSFFGFSYGMTTDLILDIHYHLYGYFQEGFQWLSLIAIILYFPSISILFLNYYPFKKSILKKIVYIILWSIFATSFEWFTVNTEFFYYDKWKLWYSAVLYPFIFLILVMNLKFVKRLINQK